MIDSTNPRVMADNIRNLTAGAQADESAIASNASAIGDLQTYDDEETDTGKKWIDGSSIYRKVIFVEHLPNASIGTYDHNITNLGSVIIFYGVIQAAAGYHGRIMPYQNIALTYTSAKINIGPGTADLSPYSAYIIIEYTKSAAPSSLTSPSPDDSRSIEPEVIEDPEIRSEAHEELIEEEPVVETKSTTRKRSTSTK